MKPRRREIGSELFRPRPSPLEAGVQCRLLGTLWVHGDCESNTEFGNDANTRTNPRFAALWERHMGERRRRLTFRKQRSVGVARQPVKVPLLIDDLDYRAAGRQTFRKSLQQPEKCRIGPV
jgi:hypothetical protein